MNHVQRELRGSLSEVFPSQIDVRGMALDIKNPSLSTASELCLLLQSPVCLRGVPQHGGQAGKIVPVFRDIVRRAESQYLHHESLVSYTRHHHNRDRDLRSSQR